MKGKIALALIGFSGAAVAATLYTGKVYQDYADRSLALVESQYTDNIVQIKYDRQHSGLFSQQEQYSLEFTLPDGNANQTVHITMNQHINFYPGFIDAKVDFDIESELLDTLLSKVSPQQDPIGTWSGSVFTGLGNYQFETERFEVNGDDGEIVIIKPFRTRGTFTLDLLNSSGHSEFDGIEIRDGFSQFTLNGFIMDADAALIGKVYDISSSEVELKAMTFNTDEVGFELADLRFSSRNNHKEGLSEFQSKVQIASMLINDSDNQLTVNNSQFDSSFGNVPTDAYLELMTLSRASEIDQAAIMTAFDNLLAKGLTFSVTDLSGEISGAVDGMALNGNYQSTGKLDLAATDLNTLQGPMALEQIDAQLQLSVSNSLFEHLPPPSLQQIEALKQQGFIATEGDKLTSKVEFSQGSLTLNGQPLAL